jgi:ammonium transporter Rh
MKTQETVSSDEEAPVEPPLSGKSSVASSFDIAADETPRSISTKDEMTNQAISFLLIGSQVVVAVLFYVGSSYDETYNSAQYVIFRDIMAMLLLGFGFLMTFIKSYGLGAVGLTMLLSVLSMQVSIWVELGLRAAYGDDSSHTSWPMPISLTTMIESEFSAATILITFGAVIGRCSPLQMVAVTLFQSVFYAFNKIIIVLGFIGAEDIGGTITIHMFGAYFGLALSAALGAVPVGTSGNKAGPESDKVSDVFSLIGTAVLWIYWPSFVGATVTGNEVDEHRCMINTVLALLGSTLATFYISHRLSKGRFDPVHIANSTLAGGVAIGAIARLNIGPGSALLVGVLSGLVSVLGYVYSTPFLERGLGIYDTCGVGNLHGWPSILGGLASIIFVAVDSNAPFLSHTGEAGTQALRQFGAMVATLGVSILSGYATGRVVKHLSPQSIADSKAPALYKDSAWWSTEYFTDFEEKESVDEIQSLN